jgi:type IV secretory pathway VirB2 component (pilin)
MLRSKARRPIIAITLVAACVTTTVHYSGSSRPSTDQEGVEELSTKSIDQVLEQHTADWMAVPGVVGTGIGHCEGRPCIKIFVAKKTESLLQKLPVEQDGYLVDVIETGEIRPR